MSSPSNVVGGELIFLIRKSSRIVHGPNSFIKISSRVEGYLSIIYLNQYQFFHSINSSIMSIKSQFIQKLIL